MIRVGVFGGMFNPPHLGHLICAQEALIALKLDRLICMPVGVPVHKEVTDDPGPERRFELCQLAFEGLPQVEVSDLEVRSREPSYTANTLTTLKESLPTDSELLLILGSDTALSLPQWYRPNSVLELASLAITERGGVSSADVSAALATLSVPARTGWFQMPRVDISSSLIRTRVKQNVPVKHLMPEKVATVLGKSKLYCDETKVKP